MSTSTCRSCRSLLRHSLRAPISFLQPSRRAATANARPSLSWYNDTTAPTSTQLEAAEKFFLSHQPRKLWTATEWRKHNDAENKSIGLIPEVAFLGRSNVGKSSLLNALLISPALNHVGPRPGKTTTMHAWAVSPTDPKTGGAVKGSNGDMAIKCAVLDMPGYGHSSRNDWGEEIMSYLKNRKQLKRVFVLVDGRHGLKSGDVTMLRLLRMQGVSAQVVVSKCDTTGMMEGKQVVEKLWDDIREMVKGPGLGLLGEVLVVGSLGDGRKNDTIHYNNMRGVREVQWAVLRAMGLDEYAVTIASQTNTEATTPTPQIIGEKVLSARIFTSPPIQNRASDPVQPQPQPPPEIPFYWPAKIRQPTSSIPGTSLFPQSLPPRTTKPMNAPALASEVASSFAGQEIDLMSMVPLQQPNSPAASRGKATQREISRPRFERQRQRLVASGTSSVKGRQVVDYCEQDPAPAAERYAARKPIETSKAWTGSAVGGMADLEALSSRSARSGRNSRQAAPKTASRRSRGKTPSVEYTEVSSPDALGKLGNAREAWTGSAVGGMADLEEMMARSSRSSGGGRTHVKKRRH